MKSRIGLPLLQALAAALSLIGCHQRETTAQLQAWVDTKKNQHTSVPEQVAVPQPYRPFIYEADADSAPFGRAKPKTPAIFNSRPAQRAPAQPLEDFPLESIQMIGTIAQEGRRLVLLQADKLVYQARTGDYIGKNFGVIRHIYDNEISLEELIPGADGRWETRIATLALRGIKK